MERMGKIRDDFQLPFGLQNYSTYPLTLQNISNKLHSRGPLNFHYKTNGIVRLSCMLRPYNVCKTLESVNAQGEEMGPKRNLFARS